MLDCYYIEGDLRVVEFATDGGAFDLVMMIFGEVNVFRCEELQALLAEARGALASCGALLLEMHPREAVQAIGWQGRS